MLKLYNCMAGGVLTDTKVFYHTDRVFVEVENFCRKNNIPYDSYFPVLDKSGECIYLLHFIENRICTSEYPVGFSVRQFFNYDSDKIVECIDFSLVGGVDVYIFEELEEYTYFLVSILAKKYLDKSFIFLDRNIYYFKELFLLGNVYYRDKIDYEKICKKKYLWITSDYKNYEGRVPEFLANIYNSINIMESMFWCSVKEHFGNKNKENDVFILDCDGDIAGLGDYIDAVARFLIIAKQRGWKFAIDLSHKPNQYLLSETENMWDYFFESLSDISVEEAYESTSVIRASVNGIALYPWFELPYFRWAQPEPIILKEVKYNKTTQNRIDELMPELLKRNNRVLGVIVRGTDYRPEANKFANRIRDVASVEDMIEKARLIMDKYGYDYVFVASEDLEYFERMKNAFRDKCLYVEQKRIYHDYGMDGEYKYLSEFLNLENGKDFGRRYLAVIQSLVKCKALISNIYNQTTRIARILKNGGYEYFEVVPPTVRTNRMWNLLQKDERIISCFSIWFALKRSGKTICKYLQKKAIKKIAIYGFGYLGKNLYEELLGSDIVVLYVIDQKAKALHISIPCYMPCDVFPQVDAVVVTFIDGCREAIIDLRTRLECPVFSLEDVLKELL